MKEKYLNITFVIDESGSMGGSESDVVGGFNKLVDEQRAVKDGKCTVSLFTFNNGVSERFIGKDVNEVKKLEANTGFILSNKSISVSSTIINGVADIDVKETSYEVDPLFCYCPGGMTAMNDGIGQAIDKVGKWLNDMPEEERPSKNLFVIMTDGMENASKEYTLAKVQEMIKHQTEKYSWSFVYMGMDITDSKAAEDLGIQNRSFSSKMGTHMYKNYSNISDAVTCYRCASVDSLQASAAMDVCLTNSLNEMTQEYETIINKKVDTNL